MPEPRKLPKCYVAEPPILEVMFEQLAYLEHHARFHCDPWCSECSRFGRIKELALRLFADCSCVAVGERPGAMV